MRPTQALRNIGQSLWLDNITRDLLESGTLKHYIDQYAVTGLTSNPSIFDNAIGGSDSYDADLASQADSQRSDEEVFMTLALDDLRQAAKLLMPVFEANDSKDGWVSMEISPLLVRDTQGSIKAAREVHEQAECPNLFVKIPGTPEGLPAIEESIYEGIPINVTLLFSPAQYEAAAEAYMRGIERRIADGRAPRVASVASLFISRWDVAVQGDIPGTLHNHLGIAVAHEAHRRYRSLLESPRWQDLQRQGAVPQRLLWASTGTKDPSAPATLYVRALAAPDTINTLPEKTLKALADDEAAYYPMNSDEEAPAQVLSQIEALGIDLDALAERLQKEGAEAFMNSWHQLIKRVREKRSALA